MYDVCEFFFETFSRNSCEPDEKISTVSPTHLHVQGKVLQRIQKQSSFGPDDNLVTLSNGMVVLVPQNLTTRTMSKQQIRELQETELQRHLGWGPPPYFIFAPIFFVCV